VTTTSGIDTREMVVVHTAFRHEYEEAPDIVRAVPEGDRSRVDRVADHIQLLLDMLHHHHAGEDRLLWPKLLDRVPKDVAPTVELMERQHEAIHAEMDRVQAALTAWRASGSASDGEALAAAIERLTPVLEEHLGAEEEQILPLTARSLTQAEWDEIGEAGMNGIPRKQMPMVFGLLMEGGDPEVLKAMLAHAPLPARLLLPSLSPRIRRRYVRQLRG
jgi:hemerythrin-like domain-containing protein